MRSQPLFHLHLDLIVDDAVVDGLHEVNRQIAAVIDTPVVAQEVLHAASADIVIKAAHRLAA